MASVLRVKLMPKLMRDRILMTTINTTEKMAISLSKLQIGLSLI